MTGCLLEHLVDVPPAVRRLAPRRPVERDVGHDPGWLSFAGEPVAGLPRQVAEQDVDLEVLLERLPLEEGALERLTERADGVGEDVVEHGERRLPPLGFGVGPLVRRDAPPGHRHPMAGSG